ncbi:hypothetical protein [Lederbergia lenta]|uniref:Uncharacterized protein n=1 Tax=Lederbergia lenta TaxID=1467 RepID=A0A2X4WBI5_LEDLE|nr:hypothetical protein [Lederbergia lenta]MEC2325496.1 hypothetical protein [Lederbergia lenta]SQI54960.1 Uncharacterised protein [Lederbergia lenta]
MRNRYLICLLLCAVMLYLALPAIELKAEGMKGLFSITWIAFVLLVIAGNLSALLFSPKRQQSNKVDNRADIKKMKRIRAR